MDRPAGHPGTHTETVAGFRFGHLRRGRIDACLTCVGHSREEIDGILDQLERAGINTLMALRGDPPKGQTEFVAHPEGFGFASELIRHVAGRGGFRMGCAFYPEVHPEAVSPEADLENLLRKQDAGASFGVSQLFYDVDLFLRFRDRARHGGVVLPLVAGLMPITNIASARRFVKSMPESVEIAVGRAGSDPDAVADAGVDQALDMVRRLVDEGVDGVHLYTLNKSRSSPKLVEKLRAEGLFPRQSPARDGSGVDVQRLSADAEGVARGARGRNGTRRGSVGA